MKFFTRLGPCGMKISTPTVRTFRLIWFTVVFLFCCASASSRFSTNLTVPLEPVSRPSTSLFRSSLLPPPSLLFSFLCTHRQLTWSSGLFCASNGTRLQAGFAEAPRRAVSQRDHLLFLSPSASRLAKSVASSSTIVNPPTQQPQALAQDSLHPHLVNLAQTYDASALQAKPVLSRSTLSATAPHTGSMPAAWNYQYQGADWVARSPDEYRDKQSWGCRQSPINIDDRHVVEGSPSQNVAFWYSRGLREYTIENNGHSVQVSTVPSTNSRIASSMGEVILNGVSYTARQFHFHAPAEHTFLSLSKDLPPEAIGTGESHGTGGYDRALRFDEHLERRTLEMHIVHSVSDGDGKGGVVLGLTFVPSSSNTPNPFLQQLLQTPGFPPKAGAVLSAKSTHQTSESLLTSTHQPGLSGNSEFPALNIHFLVNAAAHRSVQFDTPSVELYHYDGSLTTPPLTEGIRWLVVREPQEASTQQLEAFRKALTFDDGGKGNYRMIQNSPLSMRNREAVYRVVGFEQPPRPVPGAQMTNLQ